MALSFKHAFQSAKGDPVDTTLVRPSNWNAEHALSMATNRLLGRSTAGTGTIEEILLSARLALAAGTLDLVDASITYAKLQNISATSRLLGRATAAAGPTEEITVGSGLLVTGTTLSAPAFAPPGSFKNLSIKVASNTTVTVAADFVVTTNGTLYQTTAVSSTINLGTAVAVDALDTGTIAINSWYYIWVIAKADGTTKCIASLQSTANATFLASLAAIAAGAYTFYARVGAVQTINGSATLFGTWQLGRRVQYVNGLAQTTNMPVIAGSGIVGSPGAGGMASQSLARYVPPTASIFYGGIAQNSAGNNDAGAGPNNNFGASSSLTNPVPFAVTGAAGLPGGTPIAMLLESLAIYYFATSTGFALFCSGWEDNI